MYIVQTPDHTYGPFPTRTRALAYALCLPANTGWEIRPIIIPNCIQFDLKLRY